MRCQPPKSPDCNMLDLGFFASIQSLQYKTPASTTEGLISNIRAAFAAMPLTKIDRVFMSLQLVLQEILSHGGSNEFKLPHAHKDSLMLSTGLLPPRIACDRNAWSSADEAIQFGVFSFAPTEAVVKISHLVHMVN